MQNGQPSSTARSSFSFRRYDQEIDPDRQLSRRELQGRIRKRVLEEVEALPSHPPVKISPQRFAGWIGSYRGIRNKAKGIRAMENLNGDTPDWFDFATRPEPEERHKGFDLVVVTTDLREFYVKFKSSPNGVRNYNARRHWLGYSYSIAVVVCGDNDTEEEVVQRVLKEVEEVRQNVKLYRDFDRERVALFNRQCAGEDISPLIRQQRGLYYQIRQSLFYPQQSWSQPVADQTPAGFIL